MPADPPYSDSWNTPENNPLYPIPIQPMDPNDPLLLTGQQDDRRTAGAYRLDLGLKPVQTREELHTLLSLLTTIRRHIETLDLPNKPIVRTAIVNVSDRIDPSVIDEECSQTQITDDNIILNIISDNDILP